MSLPLVNDFESANPNNIGATIQAGVNQNTDGTGENFIDAVTIGTSAILAFSSVQAAHGVVSMIASTAGSSASSYATWSTSLGTQTTIFGRLYFYLSATTTSTSSIFRLMNGAAQAFAIQISSTGHLLAVNNAGATVWTSASTISVNTWYRIEFKVVASATVGQSVVSYYVLDSTTAIETNTSAATQNYNTQFTEADFGWVTAAINQPSLYMDNIALGTSFFGPAVNVPTFPLQPIGVILEIFINGGWVDISAFIYQRNNIEISGRGRSNEWAQVNPSDMKLTLNNINGPFSPNNTASPFYPYIQGNTQVRLSIDTQSTANVEYSGYRFWGEVRKWPPSWDVTGNDVYVDIVASGILTRYTQADNLGSTLKRWYVRKTDGTAPVAYWACEELTGASQFSSAIPGASDMTWTGSPEVSSDSNVGGSDPLPLINKAILTGNTSSYGFAGPITISIRGLSTWLCPSGVTTVDSKVWGASGGGNNGGNGHAGGGGEFAENTAVAVTPGTYYNVVVGRGGSGGKSSDTKFLPGSSGENSSFTGDSVTVTANGGKGGDARSPGAGGTGSSAPTHFNGGTGGSGHLSGGGGGGGSSAGTAGAGNNGSNGGVTSGGAGGSAPAGGAAGGAGQPVNSRGPAITPYVPSIPGAYPGGGGGGGAFNNFPPLRGAGASGNAGKVILNWTGGTVPPVTILRFVLDVPSSGIVINSIVAKCSISGGTLNNGRVEVYTGSNSKLGFRGFNSGGTNIFDTGLLSFVYAGAGPQLVSAELQTNGTGLTYYLQSVAPGATSYSSTFSATVASTTIGSISQIIINPNGNISDTAIGHITLQYGYESLIASGISLALSGYNGELAGDRFKRVCREEGLLSVLVSDGYWNFEDGTVQNWVGTSATIANNLSWSSVGSRSLLLTTTTTGTGQGATSPNVACVAGQMVSAYIDMMVPVLAAGVQVSVTINFLNSSFVNVGSFTSGLTTVLPGSINYQTLNLSGQTAPATTAWTNVQFAITTSVSSGTQIAIDNVSLCIGSAMGPQLDDTFMNIIQQVEDLDRGLIIEAREFFGLKYRTRTSLQNQSANLVINYTSAQLADNLQPVFDAMLIKNNITVSRINGGTVHKALTSGSLSVNLPPDGMGNYPATITANAFSDTQLANLSSWALTVGTVNDYRFPEIKLNLARSEVSPIIATIAATDCGDHIQIINAPTDRLPNSTIDQLSYGFDEVINAFVWEISMAGVPELPYTGSGFPTW